MGNSELFQLALQCLISNKQPEILQELENKIIRNEENLLRFIYLCSNHLVLPAIYIRFKELGFTDLISEELKNHLNEIYILNLKRNKEILIQIEEINNILKSRNIECIYLKGTANLMDNLYSDLGERMIGDIDLLVSESEYLEAADLIMSLGYKHQEKIFYDLKKSKHYPRLFKPDVPADIEIHRVPVTIEHSRLFDYRLIDENKKYIPNWGNCYVPSDEHKVIHNFIHSQLSNKGFLFKIMPLRDIFDFYLLSKRVNIQNFIPFIEAKNKARVYFEYSDYLFSARRKNPKPTQGLTKRFKVLHNWFLNHTKQHTLYIKFLKSVDYIFNVVFQSIVKSFYDKSFRNYTLSHLMDREWQKTKLNNFDFNKK